jgi:hypothetical protein
MPAAIAAPTILTMPEPDGLTSCEHASNMSIELTARPLMLAGPSVVLSVQPDLTLIQPAPDGLGSWTGNQEVRCVMSLLLT